MTGRHKRARALPHLSAVRVPVSFPAAAEQEAAAGKRSKMESVVLKYSGSCPPSPTLWLRLLLKEDSAACGGGEGCYPKLITVLHTKHMDYVLLLLLLFFLLFFLRMAASVSVHQLRELIQTHHY